MSKNESFSSGKNVKKKFSKERSVVFGDLHIPFHDKKAVHLLEDFIEFFKPDNIFIGGDLVDMWEISKFDRTLNIESRLRNEIVDANVFLHNLRKIAPDAKIYYIFGNHEFRFERFIAKYAKELYGLNGLSLEEQLNLKKYNIIPINSHQREAYYKYGKILIGHWNRANKHSGFTAKNLLEEKGMSLIQGHTHRGGVSYKRDYQSLKVGVENFCLCNLNPPYCSIPNWQLGFSVIFKDRESDFFKIMPVEIVKYRIMFGDNEFK